MPVRFNDIYDSFAEGFIDWLDPVFAAAKEALNRIMPEGCLMPRDQILFWNGWDSAVEAMQIAIADEGCRHGLLDEPIQKTITNEKARTAEQKCLVQQLRCDNRELRETVARLRAEKALLELASNQARRTGAYA